MAEAQATGSADMLALQALLYDTDDTDEQQDKKSAAENLKVNCHVVPKIEN